MSVTRNKSATASNPWLAAPFLVFLCVLAAVLPASREILGADALPLVLALDAVLLVLLMLGFVRRPPHFRLWVLGVLLIPLGAAVSGTNSSVTASSVVGVSLALMCVLFPCALMRLHVDRPESLSGIAAWFVLGQSVSALVAIAQIAGFEIGSGTIFGRATGLAGHPNTLGFMATVAIIAIVALWQRARSTSRWVLGLALLLNASGLLATGSLSAMLAATAAVAFGVVASRRVIGTAVSFILVGAAGFAISQLLLPENSLLSSIGYRLNVVTGESDGAGGAASLDVREQTYEWAWRWISHSPLVGVGMDPLNAGTFDGTTVVHNFLLRGWYQGGLFLVLWLTLVTLTVIAMMIRSLVTARGNWETAAAVSVIVFALTSAFLNQPTYWLPLLFAMTAAAIEQRNGRIEGEGEASLAESELGVPSGGHRREG